MVIVGEEMSRQVKVVIYYDDQICNTDVKVVFAGAQSTNLAFNRSIQLCELRIKIRRKVGGFKPKKNFKLEM